MGCFNLEENCFSKKVPTMIGQTSWKLSLWHICDQSLRSLKRVALIPRLSIARGAVLGTQWHPLKPGCVTQYIDKTAGPAWPSMYNPTFGMRCPHHWRQWRADEKAGAHLCTCKNYSCPPFNKKNPQRLPPEDSNGFYCGVTPALVACDTTSASRNYI